MAPVPGKKRTTSRAKSARASRPQVSLPLPDNAGTLFPSSKKDKQRIKHSSFVNKIEKSRAKSLKRRRPSKKLVANLESLADALPGLGDQEGQEGVVIGQAKIQRKSLKSRPGAMKRKEKLEKMERDRFNKNLAQMAESSGTVASDNTIQDRWAALRSHIQRTMEVKPEFVKM